MEITIQCTCGNNICLQPETLGNVVFLRNLDFLFEESIDISLDEDVVEDSDDVTSELKELRITCNKCKEYICMSF